MTNLILALFLILMINPNAEVEIKNNQLYVKSGEIVSVYTATNIGEAWNDK